MDKKDIFIIFDYHCAYDCDHHLQIVSKARELADRRGGEVITVCQEESDATDWTGVFSHGADAAIMIETGQESCFEHFCDGVYALIKQTDPEVLLFPATETGKAVAAVLSTRLEAGLTADCIDIAMDEEETLYFSRAAINDTVIAKIQCHNSRIKMGTVKEGAFIKKKRSNASNGRIIRYPFVSDQPKRAYTVEVLDSIHSVAENAVDIGASRIVFCIGRGVKNEKIRQNIYAIADKLGAVIVGTRAVVEEGILTKERQVGQSGKSIAPQIYVGFGVSGASQHMVGIKNAGMIVAVNNDKDAPIFQYADCKVIDDVDTIVTEMYHLLEDTKN